jgi:hypothetical protein
MKNSKNIIYNQYISYLQLKEHNLDEKVEKHHILPIHDGGLKNGQIVLCTFKEHTLAHLYRYLSFRQKGDLIAYTFMSNQNEQGRLLMASYAGSIGGKVTTARNKMNQKMFYDIKWQKKFSDKRGGKRNVENGTLAKLNAQITKNTPELRSKAGKIGGKAVTKKHKKNSTGMFDKKSFIQKKGNLVRWGVVINGKRVPYEKLSSDFIDYYLKFGNPFK